MTQLFFFDENNRLTHSTQTSDLIDRWIVFYFADVYADKKFLRDSTHLLSRFVCIDLFFFILDQKSENTFLYFTIHSSVDFTYLLHHTGSIKPNASSAVTNITADFAVFSLTIDTFQKEQRNATPYQSRRRNNK